MASMTSPKSIELNTELQAFTSIETSYALRDTVVRGAQGSAAQLRASVPQFAGSSLWYYYRDSSPLASPTLNERVRRLITDVSISILLELRRMTYVGISFRAFQGHGVRLTYHAARLSLRPTSTLAQRSPHWQQLSDHKRNVQVSILLMFTNYFRGPCPCPRPSHF